MVLAAVVGPVAAVREGPEGGDVKKMHDEVRYLHEDDEGESPFGETARGEAELGAFEVLDKVCVRFRTLRESNDAMYNDGSRVNTEDHDG